MDIKLGAHLSVSGGYHNALKNISDLGGNCLQIFASSPRFWGQPAVSDETVSDFIKQKKQYGVHPIYFHANYLINLANPEKGGKASVTSLTKELELATRMGVTGSIIHLGSLANGNYETLIKNIHLVLEKTPSNTLFIAENAGTRKIGTSIDELAKIIADVADKRMRICLDTCHLHVAGYDLSTPIKFEKFFMDFDKKIGMDCLEVIHLNDSKDEFNSHRDRHENIGGGFIAPEVFKNFLNHNLTKHLPFILEVPGFDKKGPDKKNIDILKSFIKI